MLTLLPRHFSLFSAHATQVTLCLFDAKDEQETDRFELTGSDGDGIWTLKPPLDVHAGQLYGYRVDGPDEPRQGHLFDPTRLLVDPMAPAVTGEPKFSAAKPVTLSYMPKCVTVDPAFDWNGDRRPSIPWADTVLYECHVGGLTMTHPKVHRDLRGKYLGLIEPPILAHLLSLGVTTLVLLPVHQIASEPSLQISELRNYWGYSPLAFCAPHAGYATGNRGQQVVEFKAMVRKLHKVGLEVILDVVFNHTAEGDHAGPVLSLKGIDNRTYYRLKPEDQRRYVDYTGCGNTLDVRQPAVRRLILDSLRYWVREMHIDGFRFNLGTVFGYRVSDEHAFDPHSEVLVEIAADPDLAHVKLIVDPWHGGRDGGIDLLGKFPQDWVESNYAYKDTVRKFWSGNALLGDLTLRMAGSDSDRAFRRKGPLAGLNYITSHDGFTLADLVSYEQKHNEANPDGNQRGEDNNHSCNWGCEGPTSDSEILIHRERAQRNFIATLTLSQGIPMLLHGDELGRSQGGNNNTYCQDNETSWIDWTLDSAGARLLTFVRRLLEIRRHYPALRASRFLRPNEVSWLHPEGHPLADREFWDPTNRTVAILLRGRARSREADRGTDLLLLLNSSRDTVQFRLPAEERSRRWIELFNTADVRSPSSKLRVEAFAMRGFVSDSPDPSSKKFLGPAVDRVVPNQCFIAMPYSEKWSESVAARLKEICQEAGWTSILAKNMPGRMVVNDIWQGITGSAVIIADLTKANPNVTYEVGLADVLGKEVILIAQEGSKIPFNFSGHRLILYEDRIGGVRELKSHLIDRLRKVLAQDRGT